MSGLIQNEPLCIAVLQNMLLMISCMWNISRTVPSRFCVPDKSKTNKSLTQSSLKGLGHRNVFRFYSCNMHKHKDGATWLHTIIIFTPKLVIIPRKMLPISVFHSGTQGEAKYNVLCSQIQEDILFKMLLSVSISQHQDCSSTWPALSTAPLPFICVRYPSCTLH